MAGVPKDPWSAGFGAVAGMGAAALNDKTNMTQSGSTKSDFDNSGWVVNVGSGAASNVQDKTTSSGLGGNINGLLKNPIVLIGIVFLIYSLRKK